jgi:ERCC4-related helicase
MSLAKTAGIEVKSLNALRSKATDMLQHREISCLISTLFDEAVDVPSLDVVAVAAAGASTVKTEQRIRSTRIFSGTLRTGHYTKTRGYVYYPRDNTDFLKTQSRNSLSLLKNIVKEHPKNKWVELDPYEPHEH